ncbi:uncharacterized protein PHACADRAFT_263134 [Phanerochaete carnosa HHB-10118-sp]|uniref:Uncharacterized protein n=1 Tax=Phanerochaete carnosa (strain HHB-10118-sp) TaxID=650164 RepID=K5VIN1_PHACS|nr:uncharacterized protein PHACADRAFT_263134 [Phanerochaete carnosa HHB-10118-sp]EKM51143.1 hypothetical protein PHACADRAFT_263134 [Phanerochaete carnosa HHB-10118-sp]
MSHTAEGTIRAQGPNRFVANFIMPNGQLRSFVASIDPPTDNITTSTATLTWSDDNQLNGQDRYSGTLGADVTITLVRGPTMKGTLQEPVDPTQAIVGNGYWIIS